MTALVTVSLAAPLPVPKAGEIGKRDLMDVVDFIADNKPTIDTAGKFIGKAFEKPKKTFPDNSAYPAAGFPVTGGTASTGTTFASNIATDKTEKSDSQGTTGSYSDRSYQAVPGTTDSNTLDSMNDYGATAGSSYPYSPATNGLSTGSDYDTSGSTANSPYTLPGTSGGGYYSSLPGSSGGGTTAPAKPLQPINNCGRGGGAGTSFGCSGGLTASNVGSALPGAGAGSSPSAQDYPYTGSNGGNSMPGNLYAGTGAGGAAYS